MDPKQNGNQPLDPKLQEVYDRVMGTNVGGATPSAPTPVPLTTPSPAAPTQPPAQPLPTDPLSIPQPTPSPLADPTATPTEPAPPTTPAEPSLPQEPSMPQMPSIDVPVTPSTTPVPDASAAPSTEPNLPPMPDLTAPAEPPATPPTTPVPQEDDSQLGNPLPPTQPTPPAPSAQSPMESVSATISVPQGNAETVKIGLGGSPVGAVAHAKRKGISPFILIFAAFAFLVVYGVFWVRFFGYTLPFVGK